MSANATTGCAGRRVGRYTIVRLLGAGGRGVVYEAIQDEPQRRVALKVVPSTSADAERLRYEAALLGRLHHPSIAMVHESGHDPEFGAYIAMELVEGARHLDEHVRAASPSIRDIVALYAEVCAAVAHGHANGVVHRDLKPSNILVDAHGRPKVIDFGIARALDAHRMGTTGSGQFSGTLAYTSPEQVGAGAVGLDVRSDVYALGVVLYELIAGRPPLDLDGASLDEAARRIRDDRPPRLRSVRTDVDVELEWIVAKSLEKDPRRRYASAAFLADDLRRYLAHEEISASPPTTSYRLRVFVRRNRPAIAVAAAIATLLAAGSIAAWRDRARALELAARADEAERGAAARGDELARQLAVNQEILDAQSSWFATSSSAPSGADARLVDVLDRAARTLDAAPPTHVDVEVELRHALTVSYNLIDLWEPARAQVVKERAALERGGDLSAKKLDQLARIEIRALVNSGSAHEALALAVARMETERARPGGPDPVSLSRALQSLASVELPLLDLESAAAHFREAIALAAPDTETARDARTGHISVLRQQRRYEQALTEARQLVADVSADPSASGYARLNAELVLGEILSSARQPAAALEVLLRVRSAWEELYGPDAHTLCGIDRALADTYSKLGQPKRALELARRSTAGFSRLFGADHWTTQQMRPRLATYAILADSVDEGCELFETLLVEGERENGLHSSAQLRLEGYYAFALCEKRVRLDRALELLETGVERGRTVYAREPLQLAVMLNQLAVHLSERGRSNEALVLLQENLYLLEEHKSRFDFETLSVLRNLGEVALRIGPQADALCWWRDSHARRLALEGAGGPAAWTDADRLAEALLQADQHEEADRLAAAAISMTSRVPKADPSEICRLLLVRAQAAARAGNPAEARRAFEATLAHAWSHLPESSPGHAVLQAAYATFLVSQSDFELALSYAELILDRRKAGAAPRRAAALAAAAAHAHAGRKERESEMRAIADGIPE